MTTTTDGMWKQLSRSYAGTVMSYAICSLDDDLPADEERALLGAVLGYLQGHKPRYDDTIIVEVGDWEFAVRVDDWPLQCWPTIQ
jgi:hypothetical protein